MRLRAGYGVGCGALGLNGLCVESCAKTLVVDHEGLIPLVHHFVSLSNHRHHETKRFHRPSRHHGQPISRPKECENRAISARIGSAGVQGSIQVLPYTSSLAVPRHRRPCGDVRHVMIGLDRVGVDQHAATATVILGNANTPRALNYLMPLLHWAMPSKYHLIHKNDLARAMVAQSEQAFLAMAQGNAPKGATVKILEYKDMEPFFIKRERDEP
jgi:hypothetical protein